MIPVFRKAFRDARWTLIGANLGLALLGLLSIATYPTLVSDQESLDTFNELIDSYPEALGGFMEGFDTITEPASWLNVQFTIWMVLILGAVVIAQVFNGTLNAERDGTMDVMLSLPITRREMLLGRMLNTFVTMMLSLTLQYLMVLACTVIWPEFAIDPLPLAAGVYAGIFPLMILAGVAYLIVTIVPSSKRWAGPVVYFFFYGSYLLHSLAGATDSTERFRPLFIFEYFNVPEVINDGIPVLTWLALTAIIAVLLTGAWWRIDHKEIGV